MPSQKSLRDLSGKWHMSSTLTTDVSPVLKIQGFNAVTRSLASKAPITLSITHKSSPASEIYIKQSTTASIPAVNEEWYPDDNEWRETNDAFLGKVKARARWCTVGEVKGKGFLTEGLEGSEEVVEAVVEGLGSTEWKATQVWCFEGERFVRRVVTEGQGGERAETRLVYEFEG